MTLAPGAALILGGARSGKSRYAETCAAVFGKRIYVATAEARDDEMARRIAAHRDRRGAAWTTLETPIAVPETIAARAAPDGVVLVDCLTLWLTNLMLGGHDVHAARARLAAALVAAAGPVLLVANEVGLGLVPETPLGRAFRDAAGALNQEVAACCGRVVFVAAGLPLTLKGAPEP